MAKKEDYAEVRMTEPGYDVETIKVERRFLVGTVFDSVDAKESMIHVALRMVADRVVHDHKNMTTGQVRDAFSFTYRDHEFTVHIKPTA